MRVLLTRAVADADRTRTILERLGHRVLVSPVITIEATGALWPGGVVDAVLATSAQAFTAIGEGRGPMPEARRLMPMWLVGQRTERVARAQGFAGPTYVAPNAVSLAFEISKWRGRRVVYLAGRDRKPDIETALTVMQQPIEIVEVYEAKRVDRLRDDAEKAFRENSIDAALHFSRRSASLLAELLAQAEIEPQTLHVCLSDDVAQPLVEMGWPVRVAAEPTECFLIEALTAT